MVRLNTVINGVLACQAATVQEHDLTVGQHQMDENLNAFVSAEAGATLELLSKALVDPEFGDKVNIEEGIQDASHQMDVGTAARLMEKKTLPPDVSNLVAKVQTNSFGAFSEESLAKARRALNELVEKAWIELDDKIFKCKGFQEMNRETYGQVGRDISRLLVQINDMSRIESESIAGISQKEQEIIDVETILTEQTALYNTQYAENKADLTTRQNDLDVFQFVLVFTKCPDATSLSQTGVKVCEYRNGPQHGRKTLVFADKKTASKYDKILTPSTRRMIDGLLRSVENVAPASLLQQPSNVTVAPQPSGSEPVEGAEGKEFDPLKISMTCGPDPPDCALLHDKLSLMWGEFRDSVDELTMEMMKNQYEFEEIKFNLNGQISMITTSKSRFSQLLSEARSNLAADRGEVKEKNKQKVELDSQYYKYMMKCKKRIAWILGQDMCAIKTVRNAVLENSTECPTEKIQDCVMDDWVPEACTVSCDDSCDPATPFKCGGWQEMKRKAVVTNDECGIKCPSTSKYMRCGQYHCPIDCHMSTWSGWSKCTADCEGGLQSHTRSIHVKPRNGGEMCNTEEESRPCNTESCDRDCRLAGWTKWAPCSVACGTGFQEQYRHITIPTRGDGKCPKRMDSERYRHRECNVQSCNGDEICIAKQDLIIAVDGSGSVRATGFKTLTDWVGVLLDRYMTEYYGSQAVKLGIVLFGNGVIMPDGNTVSPAINAQKLSFDMEAIKASVSGLPFKKGFTNMAQAFAMAEDMFVKGSRKGAQQSVMVVTDGKPSFSFQTNEMVDQLDDKGIMRYFVIVSETPLEDDSMKNMKLWASQPWETNVVHVPSGLLMLEADPNLWAEKAITRFCPEAHSEMADAWEVKTYGFQHVKDSGWCGDLPTGWSRSNVLSKNTLSAETCAALAGGANYQSFMLGTFFLKGTCVGVPMEVSAEQYSEWGANKKNPSCPTKWHSSMMYDFYAMEPVAMQSGPV